MKKNIKITANLRKTKHISLVRLCLLSHYVSGAILFFKLAEERGTSITITLLMVLAFVAADKTQIRYQGLQIGIIKFHTDNLQK